MRHIAQHIKEEDINKEDDGLVIHILDRIKKENDLNKVIIENKESISGTWEGLYVKYKLDDNDYIKVGIYKPYTKFELISDKDTYCLDLSNKIKLEVLDFLKTLNLKKKRKIYPI